LFVLVIGGGALLFRLLRGLLKGEFGADWLAGLSIVTSLLLGEYLAGVLVVLMLSGGEALEGFALGQASSVLDALARRMPATANKRDGAMTVQVPAEQIQPGDEVVVFPHELCPVDGVVLEGHSAMDESYLTGEPYRVSKVPGCPVISGAVNGDGVITIRAERRAQDSRYAMIMAVMDSTRQRRPRARRLGDLLGGLYTPFAVVVAVMAWWLSKDSVRFLAVLVVATPCPLLIAIPVAIIGAVSWCARRAILIKDPIVLERAKTCSILITDKTGTLTIGEPTLTTITTRAIPESEALRLAASLEQYSKHPLASAVLAAAKKRGLVLSEGRNVREEPGKGLTGILGDQRVTLVGRKQLSAEIKATLPKAGIGLECFLLVDGAYAATFRFLDEPRPDSHPFVSHLGPTHGFQDVILLSGDRDEEVQYLAGRLGITRVYSGKSPEEKVEIVREESKRGGVIYLGDGVNDAPALVAATVGIAFGPKSDITSEAAGAVILDPSLRKVDQFLHISAHLRRVLLQSALGGMALSLVAMVFAAAGMITPVWGALIQEGIDLVVVVNALRAAALGRSASDI